jgi:hypothetical protein
MDKNTLKQAIQQNRIKSLAASTKTNMPSIPQMARNLGNDVIKNVKSVAAGNPLNSDQAEADRRKGICNNCEFFDKNQERCTKCGCYMAVKVYLKASSCPVGKW